ncbi:hypothetical protein D9M71_543400 [compost metagenome]
MLATEEGALGHHRIDEAVLLQTDVLHVGENHHAGVVHQHVETTEMRQGLGDHFLPAQLVAHVVLEEQRSGDARSDLAPQLLVDVGEHHSRALLRQQPGIGGAQPRCRAGNQHNLPCYTSHG